MQRSIVVYAPIEVTFERVLGDPLPTVFDRGFALLPAITGTRTLAGAERWGTQVDQRRRILLADGGEMTEHLRVVDSPHRAEYTMSELTGPFAVLFDGVLGTWSFAAVDGGTRVTWAWRLRPRSVLGRIAVAPIAWMWQGYAGRALERLQQAFGAPAS